MLIILPPVLRIDEMVAGNHVQQLAERRASVEGNVATYVHGRFRGSLFQPSNGTDEILVAPRERQIPPNYSRVVLGTAEPTDALVDLAGGRWIRHPLAAEAPDYTSEIARVLDSWSGAFSYVQEDAERGVTGLRGPQIGALHAIHAHWSVNSSPATVVMPTGTGKTETMLSALVSARCSRLLVVVPTDALRTQIAQKFLTLGVLKEPGCAVLSEGARLPIVAVLRHIPRSTDDIDSVFARSQVIITTSSIAGQCSAAVQERMAELCPYLFIDEAHHAEAPTWSAFKARFRERRILQFTATPFREDGKPLDGDIIFKYPLKKAQQEGYFTPIRFSPVVEFNRKRSDTAIARRAVETLRAESDKGHILMARVDSVARAEQVFDIYRQFPEFNPVQLHTGIKSTRERDAIREQVIRGHSRIVVCVDMLGEGFDLPELKIAAFHDIRKTLAVTLQLAGRFTRSRPDLGDATFVANTADVFVQDELRKLYTRDPDWNTLLPELSNQMIGEQVSLQEFLRGFTDFTTEIPLKTVRPAMSAVVYRTRCTNWTPENFRSGIPGLTTCGQVYEAINHAKHTLVVVTARRVPLAWSDVEKLHSWEWELYVAIWIPELNLLFINSSSNAGEYKALAEAVAGGDVLLVRGQDVFRTFAGVNRLRLQNVGLTEQLGRNVRYTGRMGADVAPALSDVHLQRARKAVLSGSGYEDGAHVTLGASRKGRIWSHRRERVDQLAEWCQKVGKKLLDPTIDPDEVLRGTLDVQTVTARPEKMPIGVDWPEEIYRTPEQMWSVVLNGHEWHLSEVSIEIATHSLAGALRIAIVSDTDRTEIELELFEDEGIPNYRFVTSGDEPVRVSSGGSHADIADFFYSNPPSIWFADGSSLEGNQYVELRSTYPPFDREKIQAWEWSDTDIRRESQGPEKNASSIQATVIRELRTRDYALLFDDDSKGEAADVVAVRLAGDSAAPTSVDVEFYHCKYSREDTPGRRIDDLYELCGQAQKCVAWTSSPEKRSDLFTHLLRREALRQESGGATRFEIGDGELLLAIREMTRLCPVTLKVFIVQPGLSKALASDDQLRLLSVTEHYLHETYQLPFGVIASA